MTGARLRGGEGVVSVRILVVDDSGTDREIVRSMLLGYDLLVACDGVEALQVIDENPDIGLVVLDLHMPRMDGFEVLKCSALIGVIRD